MIRSTAALISLHAIVMLAAPAPAATPGQINYQGLLLDQQGAPITGNVNLVFTIFSAASGGSALWTESHPSVAALDGVYDVVLGATTPITPAVVAGGSLFLQITVNGETLVPRQRLVAVPYALRAAEADNVGGFDAGYITEIVQHVDFDGGAPANDDPSEGLTDVDGDGRANFIDSDNDADGLQDAAEVAQSSNINLITPTIAVITPGTVEASLASTVAVTGTNFEPGLTVAFGSVSTTPQSLTATSFNASVGPQAAGTVAAKVTRTNGEFAQKNFTFVENQPVISSFSPVALEAGQSGVVTVTGSGFAPGLSVTFGNQTPTAQNVTATSFQVNVGPQTAGAKQVQVSYPSGKQAMATYEFVDSSVHKLAFATSTTYNGSLGGIAGGDAKCAARAAAASLSGTYKAFLGDSTGSPNTSFTRGAQYYLVDGTTLVAQSYGDLTDGTLQNGILKNEFGSTFGAAAAWTGTNANGTAHSNHCSNWSTASSSATGRVGQAGGAGSGLSINNLTCNEAIVLFCFQQ